MSNTYAIVLAAGQGTRMKSSLYKVLHPVCGKPMVAHVIDHVQQLGTDRIVSIVGHGAEKVEQTLGNVSEYALQAEQLGTAHAVMQAESVLGDLDGTTIVICGDTPLIRPSTMEKLIEHHGQTNAKATILTAFADDPAGYGRIIRGEQGEVLRNVEHKDATEEERLVQEINTGTYCFDNRALFEALHKVNNDNAQGEYYLPDVLSILREEGAYVGAYATDDFSETLGVNDRVALSQAEETMRLRIAEEHMRNGVTIINPQNTYISAEAEIGRDTVLQPGTMIEGNSVIGSECLIGPNSQISNSTIGDRVSINASVVLDSEIGSDTTVGPYAHIRPETQLGENVRIGNFVEVKKSTIGHASKVSHLSYIGDAEIGSQTNFGCGSITVNYDGKNKHVTTVGDGVFIGCNTNLVAPVQIGDDAFVAAGSTVTKDVPGDALAIGRARQENKEGYVSKLKLK